MDRTSAVAIPDTPKITLQIITTLSLCLHDCHAVCRSEEDYKRNTQLAWERWRLYEWSRIHHISPYPGDPELTEPAAGDYLVSAVVER